MQHGLQRVRHFNLSHRFSEKAETDSLVTAYYQINPTLRDEYVYTIYLRQILCEAIKLQLKKRMIAFLPLYMKNAPGTFQFCDVLPTCELDNKITQEFGKSFEHLYFVLERSDQISSFRNIMEQRNIKGNAPMLGDPMYAEPPILQTLVVMNTVEDTLDLIEHGLDATIKVHRFLLKTSSDNFYSKVTRWYNLIQAEEFVVFIDVERSSIPVNYEPPNTFLYISPRVEVYLKNAESVEPFMVFFNEFVNSVGISPHILLQNAALITSLLPQLKEFIIRCSEWPNSFMDERMLFQLEELFLQRDGVIIRIIEDKAEEYHVDEKLRRLGLDISHTKEERILENHYTLNYYQYHTWMEMTK